MIHFAILIAAKDLRIIFKGFSSFAQALLLGLVLIFVFSLAKSGSALTTPQEAATIFWLSSTFCQILVFNQLYAIEEANDARECLILTEAPVQSIWLGKLLSGMLILIAAQIIFLIGVIIFLGQNFNIILLNFLSIFLVNLGICAIGSLLGGISQAQSGKESLLSIVVFPLLIPLLLGGIYLLAHIFGAPSNGDDKKWLGIILAFDAIFLGAALLVFGYIFQGDD